jgi:hypothetical protein
MANIVKRWRGSPARCRARVTFRESNGVPTFVANTYPSGSANRRSAWVRLCSRSMATEAGLRRTVRRPERPSLLDR